MIYLLHQLSQKPQKMADGGMSLTSGQVNGNMQVPANQAQGGAAAQPVQNVVGQWANPGGVYSGITGGVGQGLGDVMGGLSKGMAQGTTFQNGFQAQLAPTQQFDYGQVINGGAGAALNGYQQYLQNLSQQQGLAGTFQGQANGTAPSVAQTQLNTATGNNIASQAALMASQRGASANAGMTARNAARVGAATQQDAAGQAATLRLQEQQQAQKNLMDLYNSIGTQGISEQGANTNLFGTAAGANNAQNNTLVNNYGMAQGINADVAAQNTAALNKSASSGMGAIGGMLAALKDGGMAGVDGYADGGDVQPPNNPYMNNSGDGSSNEAQSFVGQYLSKSATRQQEANKSGGLPGMSMITSMMGGSAHGNIVPGKAQVSGDSEQNDTVHALLSPGEIVVPRSAAQDPDKAAAFAKSVAMNHGRKGKK